VVFDVDETVAATRRDAEPDRMERKGADYHRRVREGYLAQSRRDAGRYVVIDAGADADEVHDRTMGALRRWVGSV
jgi:dTMP kinase